MTPRWPLSLGLTCLLLHGGIKLNAAAARAAAEITSTGATISSPEGMAAGQEVSKQRDDGVKTAGRVSVSVVFAGGTDFEQTARATCDSVSSDKLQDCFAKEMKKAKATPAAVEFSKQLGEPGFVREFKAAGPVDIAYVTYPYRANENQSCLIVNGDPAIIDVDNHKLVSVEALKSNATFLTLAKTHKELSLWPSDRYGTETPDVQMGANAGAHVLVNYRLREQCHACAVLGHAWFSFDFDPQGKFAGAKFVGMSVTHETTAVAREGSKPVTVSVGEEFTVGLPVAAGGSSDWILSKALDPGKLRLIEHSHVAPPSKGGAQGTEELWKFAAVGVGTTQIEFQKGGGGKTMTFRVTTRGTKVASGGGRKAR